MPSRMSRSTSVAAGLTNSRLPNERSSTTMTSSPALDEGVDEVRADEPRAACDRYAHTPYRRARGVHQLRGTGRIGEDDPGGAARRRGSREQGHEVVATREPGGTPLGEAIRDVVLHGLEMTAWAEATLFASARAEHVARVIRPALDRGAWVDLRPLHRLVARLPGDRPRPRRRAGARAEPRRSPAGCCRRRPSCSRSTSRLPGAGRAAYLDRIEREDAEFRQVVADGYRELGDLFPERVTLLDGSQPPDAIAEEVREQVRAL